MERLRQRADFLAVADGVRVAAPAFTLQSRRRDDAGPARVGFTVTKKNGTATERNRSKPMRMPPSKRMTASATVPTCSTEAYESLPSQGQISDASAAAIRKNAGAGIRSRSLARLDSTAATAASAHTRTARPNDSMPYSSAQPRAPPPPRCATTVLPASRQQRETGRRRFIAIVLYFGAYSLAARSGKPFRLHRHGPSEAAVPSSSALPCRLE